MLEPRLSVIEGEKRASYSSRNSRNGNLVETICAAGYALPPIVINKGSAQYMGLYTNLTATMADYHFSYSPNGWTEDAVALKWLTELFEPCTASIAPSLEY